MSKLLRGIVVGGLVLFACDLALYRWYDTTVIRWGKTTDPPSGECAAVLFSDFSEDGVLDDEAIRRCRCALELFQYEKASVLLCSGGNLARKDKSGAKIMFQWLSRQGVPRKALRIESESCDTLSNIRNCLNIAGTLGYRSLLVVSSPLHLYRTSFLVGREIRRKGMTIRYAPYPYEKIPPRAAEFDLLKQTHYEWLSFGLYFLIPKSLYNRIIYCPPPEYPVPLIIQRDCRDEKQRGPAFNLSSFCGLGYGEFRFDAPQLVAAQRRSRPAGLRGASL
jgi:vancomycin permeability regulator SanA